MKYAFYLLSFSFLCFIAACGGSDDEATACKTDNITYTNTVKAIFENNNCTNAACHPSTLSGLNFSLATYQDALNFNRNDKMVQALRWEGTVQRMPRDTATQLATQMLPDCDIDKIEAWINAGRPQ